MNIMKQEFGKTKEGKAVDIYTLVNDNNGEIRITNYGGIIVSLKVPDKNGQIDDVVLGYNTLTEYMENSPYFGALIGRYGNRIAKGTFELNGKKYTMAINNGPNHLHGGIVGFDKVVWNVKEIQLDNAIGLELSYLSKDGEEGYPGNLNVTVKYLWTNDNELTIEYAAATDKTTVVNLTSHSYFNLAGKGDNLNHEMMIDADKFTPVDDGLIPTGEFQSVEGTPFDFTSPTKIGARIDEDNEQLKYGQGYDHNFVINDYDGTLRKIVSVYEPMSGRLMEVSTTEPGVQFYSGNYINESMVGKEGLPYKARSGFCLETQHFPDSPNQPDFPTTTLEPGQKYSTTTVYKFSTK